MEIYEALHIKSLILKDLNGEINAEEKQVLEKWTAGTPANRQLREKIATTQFMKQVVADESGLVEKQWEKLEIKTVRPVRKSGFRFLKYAAIFLIPILTTTYLWQYYSNEPTPTLPDNPSGIRIELADGSIIPLQQDTNTYIEKAGMSIRKKRDSLAITSLGEANQNLNWHKVVIPKGMDYIVCLEDGTYVHLNTESTLEFPNYFSSLERRIRLSGGAYLNVHHENNRPFIVETSKSQIKVLGTQFDLRAYPDDLKTITTLIRGSVEVTSDNQQVLLQPGHQAIISADGSIQVQPVEPYRYIAWRDRRLVFENEYITDIIEELKHWYNYNFIITDPDVREIRISMNIERFDDFNDLKTAIEKIEKIHFQINGKIVKITR